ncbi:fibronectin type III domain-containing protein [Streptomyces sp. CA-106110]|uniref:fibronectin type III domain-containing protein n=1 Tax=Streptomyces sp. CA-106110 TaxID=3240044 RepID=UPI003D90BF46
MPGCDFTRRDLLRWAAVAAAAPVGATAFHGVASAATRGDDISPANLELVTLTEDRAVITWYTGSDDGLGRMVPTPSDGEVRWGTHPDRLNRVATGISSHTPYHYVELTGLEPGRTYYYQATSHGEPVPPTAFTLIKGNAVGTSDYGLDGTGPYSFTGFLRGCPGLQAGEESDSCGAGQGQPDRRQGDPASTPHGRDAAHNGQELSTVSPPR